MDNKGVKPSITKQRKLLIALCVFLALVLVVLIFATVYVETLFGRLSRPEENPSLSSDELAALIETDTKPADYNPDRVPATLPSEPAEVIEAENVVNFLLVGADKGGNLSDSMIMCTVHKAEKTITLTSFLRDSYVDIPEYFPHKLNTAYSLGGFEVLNDTLEYNFGIQIDGNVGVNFDSFTDVVDAIGGVEVELTEDEAWHLNGLLGWDLTEGVNLLTGEQALNYARIRALDGDVNRANRQRIVISALLEKAKTLSVSEMNDMLMTVLPMISTDMSNSEIVNYALDLLPLVKDLKISTQQIPVEGTYHLDWVEQDGGMSIIEIDDFDANIEVLKQILAD